MRARAESWKHQPFTVGRAVPYKARFTASEYTKLQEGLIPDSMDDKWFVYFDEDKLFFHRSWTGRPVYRLTLAADAEGATVTEALDDSDPLEKYGAGYQAKLLDFLVCNLLLGKNKPFPLPPDVDESAAGVFQHHISGTGYPQVRSKPEV